MHDRVHTPHRSPPRRILVVDEDDTSRDALGRMLTDSGFATTTVANGSAMFDALWASDFELMLIELRLGREDGLTLARRVRSMSDMPIVMMTGEGDTLDLILGLEVVADDYVMKPIHPRELVARVHAVLRRVQRARPGPLHEEQESPVPTPPVVRFGNFRLDFSTRGLFTLNGVPQSLTPNEFDLLELLVRNANRTLSREALLQGMRRGGNEVLARAIDVLVMRLRRKIESNPAAPRFLRTERGTGYKFCVSESDQQWAPVATTRSEESEGA